MASAMLRGGKVFWWLTPPAIGLTYHLSTVKAADNPTRKIDPKDLEIYDKMDEQKPAEKNVDIPTPLEEQISKGRKFVWKHSESAKKATESTTGGFKAFLQNTKEFAKNLQTDRSLQVKTGAITLASLTGLVLAGKGRRPLRRVFFAGGLGTATAAICYPSKAGSVVKKAYGKVSTMFQRDQSEPSKKGGAAETPQDPLRSGETLVFEEAIALGEMVYDDLRERVHVEDVHVPDFLEVCNDVVQEILLGISEDFEIQTGGFVGGKHEHHDSNGFLLHAEEITKHAVQEILDAIDEDLDIKSGGVHTEVPTIALDSTVLAKDISANVTKALEDDLSARSFDKQSYLFSDPEKLATLVSEEYVKCVEVAINAQVKTGRCHVLLNTTSIAAKTGAELRQSIEQLKKRRAGDLVSSRPVKVSDSRVVSNRISASLLEFIEDHVKSSRGDYGYSEAGHIVQKASKEATKTITESIEASGKAISKKIALDMKQLAESITEEANAAVEEDIEIQTGSGFRDPLRKPRTARKPSEPVQEIDANALEGVMLSPMYVPGFDHLADAVSTEIKESLHGRGVVITELDHMAQVITKDVLEGINEDIEIQTGGWAAPDHKPHVVLSARDLIKMAAREVLDAIEEDMAIQIGGGSVEAKRDLFLDSTELSGKIIESIMREVEGDMKATTDAPFLFSLPGQLSEMATKELADDIEEASMGVGRHLHRIHIDVDGLADKVGRQLKERIEASYIRAKAMGELSSDREIEIVDLDEIRKKVGSTLKENLEQNPLVTLRPGNEPLHVVEEVSDLTKRVVDEMTKAIQEDIDIQTGGAVGHGKRVVIDARQLTKRVIEEMEDALEEDFDIQTGRGFRKDHNEAAQEEAGNPGQSEASDKDMYSTRSS